jgi:hypothetical protein
MEGQNSTDYQPKDKMGGWKYEFQHSDIFIFIQNDNVPVMKFLFAIWLIGIEIEQWLSISTKKYSLFLSSLRVFAQIAPYLLSLMTRELLGRVLTLTDANTRNAVI